MQSGTDRETLLRNACNRTDESQLLSRRGLSWSLNLAANELHMCYFSEKIATSNMIVTIKCDQVRRMMSSGRMPLSGVILR